MTTALAIAVLLAGQNPNVRPDGWHRSAAHTFQSELWLGGAYIGAFNRDKDQYYPWDAATKSYGQPCPPPVPIARDHWPSAEQIEKVYGPRRVLTGVVADKVKASPAYSSNDGAITRDQAFGLLHAAAKLPADKGRVWATIVGTPAARKPVADYLTATFGDRVILPGSDGYSRDEWQVAPQSFGELPAGEPVVLIQGSARPDGKAFAHWLQVGGDTAALAAGVTEALRKADPNWRPNVPGPLNPLGPLGGGIKLYDLVAVAAAVVFLFMVLAGAGIVAWIIARRNSTHVR